MSKQLPPHPNLRQLKNQAKDLRRAHSAAVLGIVPRLKAHLPRFAETLEADVLSAAISLQDCQHVVAREYGFESWNWLRAVVEIDFELLLRFGDSDVQRLLREVDWKDLKVALAPIESDVDNATSRRTAIRDKVLNNMPEWLRSFFVEELELPETYSPSQVRETQQRILKQADQMAMRGMINWPDGMQPTVVDDLLDDVSMRLRELARQPLEAMSTDEIVELWVEMTTQARRLGILSLEPLVAHIASPFVREALRLALVGTAPDLLRDILETRLTRAILPQKKTQCAMIVEATMAIQSRDRPRLIRYKMDALYKAQSNPLADYKFAKTTADECAQRLQRAPVAIMDFDQLADLLVDLSALARSEGVGTFAILSKALEGQRDLVAETLRRALEMMLAEDEPEQVMTALETRVQTGLVEWEKVQRAVVVGTLATQRGDNPESVAQLVRAAVS